MSNELSVDDESGPGAETTLTGPLPSLVEERSRVRFLLLAQPWRVRLLGVLVAAVCAVASFALLAGLTGGVSHPGPNTSLSVPGHSSHGATSRAFSRVPQPCALLSASTVAEYLPGGTCSPGYSLKVPGQPDSRATWSSTGITASGDFFDDDVEVSLLPPSIMSMIGNIFDYMKSLDATTFSGATIRDSRPVAGLGDEAYIVFRTDVGGATTYLVVDDGNAQIDIKYDATADGRAPLQAWAEAAVLTMAHDIIKGLR